MYNIVILVPCGVKRLLSKIYTSFQYSVSTQRDFFCSIQPEYIFRTPKLMQLSVDGFNFCITPIFGGVFVRPKSMLVGLDGFNFSHAF